MPNEENLHLPGVLDNAIEDPVLARNDLSHRVLSGLAINNSDARRGLQLFDPRDDFGHDSLCRCWIVNRNEVMDFFQLLSRRLRPSYFVFHDSARFFSSSCEMTLPLSAASSPRRIAARIPSRSTISSIVALSDILRTV